MKTLKIKKTMVAALALMMVIPTSAFAKSAPKTGDLPPQARNRVVEFQVNGKKVNANPDMGKWFISKEGRTFLPIRLFKEAMGYDMVYDVTVYETRSLILTKDKEGNPKYKKIWYDHKMDRVDPVDNDACLIYDNEYGDTMYFKKDELPILYGNRLYMPARKVLETMGEEVQWKSLPDRDIVNVIKK
ncbi:MAG: hypothetical protein KHZ78_07365 [Peptoniphilus sp. oral taxon 375]|nr:hypothetical protein [Peptoniphilus sp. oral taxon 375]